ncbi:MAG: TetR/AcrR family transcriptional regulator [Gammaproteobacteria bacterium]|nr:MAG: TetR/AcrR family transcriptional regulator [Gammaproteobacteria bacterium]
MTASLPARSRALDATEKAARRQAILDAAHRLLVSSPDTFPSVAQIAAAAGLAKGTVYLYFSTKEDILLTLLGAHYTRLLDTIEGLVQQAGALPADALRTRFVACLRDYILEHPDYMVLACSASAVLEANASEDVILAFKRTLAVRLRHLGEHVHQLFPRLSPEAGIQLLIQVHASMLGLWQMHRIPEKVRQWLEQESIEWVVPQLDRYLDQAVHWLWLGALGGASQDVADGGDKPGANDYDECR